jgi:hypothetical protein
MEVISRQAALSAVPPCAAAATAVDAAPELSFSADAVAASANVGAAASATVDDVDGKKRKCA